MMPTIVLTVDLMDIFLFLALVIITPTARMNITVLKMITTRIGARKVVKNTIVSLMKQVSIILFSASFTTNMSVFLPVARVAREDTTATSGDTVGESVQFVI